MPFDDGLGALTREALELLDRLRLDTTFLGATQYALSDRMLRLALQSGCPSEDFALGQIGQSDHPGNTEPAFRQRSGLIKQCRAQAVRTLKSCAVADKETVVRRKTRAHRNDQRHRQTERMGTGNDHHRGHSLYCIVETESKPEPGDESGAANGKSDVGQP